jgi:hypothetical protein
MKKDDSESDDELRPEYDLKRLRVRRLGSERTSFAGATAQLEPGKEHPYGKSKCVS